MRVRQGCGDEIFVIPEQAGMTRNSMLRVGFERNYESGIPGCGIYLRERVVSGFRELMVRDFGSEGDA